MKPRSILLVVGARPNFIKAAPLYRALSAWPKTEVRLLHTGQHADPDMSAVFFRELGLPEPWITLGGKGRTGPLETARILSGMTPCLQRLRPDWVLVIGDITSTLAATMAAKQLGLRVAHVEAGLRSHDRGMPEELNRIAVDHWSDLLFPSEEAGVQNLRQEGIPAERIFFAGNVLIDALAACLPLAAQVKPAEVLANTANAGQLLPGGPFALFTFHRPSNVDTAEGLALLVEMAGKVADRMPVVFPLHPRTAAKFRQFRLLKALKMHHNVLLAPPLGYIEMVSLMRHARVVVTDSGGVQEETTWLGTPCLTFRCNTERPATVVYGTNTLISDRNPVTAVRQIDVILAGQYKQGRIPPLWDGLAAGRVARYLLETSDHS